MGNQSGKLFILEISATFTKHGENFIHLAERAEEEARKSKTKSQQEFWFNLSKELRELSVQAIESSLKNLHKQSVYSLT